MKDYISDLKIAGFSSQEIRIAIEIKAHGVTMTKAIHRFNALYDYGDIDGFPESSIEVLEKFYGKQLKKMKNETLFKKVMTLQNTIVSEPDEDSVKEAVEYYLTQ